MSFKVLKSYNGEGSNSVDTDTGNPSKVILDYDDMQEQTGWLEIPDTDGLLSISLNGYIDIDPNVWPLDVRIKSNTGTTTMYRITLHDYTNSADPPTKSFPAALSLKSKDSAIDLTDLTDKNLQTPLMLLVYDVKVIDTSKGAFYHLEITIVHHGQNRSQILSKRIS